MANDDIADFCSKLAEHGYYTEFVEYYSQTAPASRGDLAGMMRDFPTWLSEVHSGIAALKKNPSVNSNKVALMGFSLGSYISLSYGARYPDDVSAIVEYYGGRTPALYARASSRNARRLLGMAAIRPIFCVRRKSGASLSNERWGRTLL
jgi:dienelactone hydrolase